jgi:hypothetical protein
VAISTISIDGNLPLRVYVADSATRRSSRYQFGLKSVPELSFALTYGTGSGKANKIYTAQRTVTATTADNLDLAGSLTDLNGSAITFTKIKLILIAIVSPDGTKTLRVGPRGVSNTYQGAFGGTGATVYKDFTHWDVVEYEPVTGRTVTAGTGDILGIYNPSASSVTYEIIIAGE